MAHFPLVVKACMSGIARPECSFEWNYTTLLCRDIRRYFLDSPGIIGLTLSVLLSPVLDALEQLGQLQEIRYAKGSLAGREHHTGVGGMQTGPGRWQRADMLRGIIEGDAILPPVMPIGQDLKLLAVEGMKGMGDREHSLRKRWRGCS